MAMLPLNACYPFNACYSMADAALEVNRSAAWTFACVFAIADFMINPARAGMQTHMD